VLTTLKRWRFALIGLLVSLLAGAFFISQMNLAQFGEALQNARLIMVPPTALLIVLGLTARAVRWRVLLGAGLPFWRAFHILNVAYFANGILPLRLGELARAYLASLGDPSVPPLRSLSTVIVERLLDVLAVLVLMALALAFAPLPDVLRASALLFAPLTFVGFVVLVIVAGQRERALAFVRRWGGDLPFDLVAFTGHFLDGLAPLTQPRAFALALVWTAISWSFSVASGYVLMFAFFPQGDLAATLLFTSAASFAVAVPAVPGNLGTYEASVWVGLAAMGYGEPLAIATAFAVTIHGLNLFLNALLGAIGLYAEGVSLGQLQRGVRGLRTKADSGV